jgi:hypothetical protein
VDACRSAKTLSEKNWTMSTSAFVEVTPVDTVEPFEAMEVRRKMAVSLAFQFSAGLAL